MAENIWCPITRKHLISIDNQQVLSVLTRKVIGHVRSGSIYDSDGRHLCYLTDLEFGYGSDRDIPKALEAAATAESPMV